MNYGIDYEDLPKHIQDSMRLYVEEGIRPGGFCEAALADKLVEAFAKADDVNTYRMHIIARWLYNECPSDARGSYDAVNAWVEAGGLKGMSFSHLNKENQNVEK